MFEKGIMYFFYNVRIAGLLRCGDIYECEKYLISSPDTIGEKNDFA
jgi:hypothetical protein